MAEVHLRKYGVETTVDFELFEIDGVDLRVDAADGGTDCTVMKDEGAEATATNDFTDEGTGYSLVLTATEMEAARIMVYLVDTDGTKVYLDKAVCIETYGHASAQHGYDLDADALRLAGATIVTGTVDTGAGFTPTTAAFEADDITEATADHYNGRRIIWTSGNLQNQATSITDYELSGSNGKFTVDAMTEAPANNDTFIIL